MLRTFTRFLYTRKMLDADPLWVALNKRKSPSEAQLLLDSQDPTQLKPIHFHAVMQQTKNPTTITGLIEKMKKYKIQRDAIAYTLLISAYCERGHMEKAMEILRSMEKDHVKPNKTTYSIIIKGYVAAGDIRNGMELLQEMKQHGIPRNVVIYSSLMHGHASKHDPEGGRALLSAMIDDGVMPNAYTFASLINCYIKNKDLHGAVKCLEQVVDTVPTAISPVLFNIIIDGYVKAKNFPSAFKIYETMQKELCFPNVITYTSLITGCTDPDVMHSLYTSMKQRGILPNNITYQILIKNSIKLGKLENVPSYIESMVADNIFPTLDIFQAIVLTSVEKHRPEFAYSTFEMMREYRIEIPTSFYALVGEEFIKRGDLDQARKVLDEMILEQKSDPTFLDLLVNAFGAKDLRSAEEIFEMHSQTCSELSRENYLAILRTCANLGATEKAQEYFSRHNTQFGFHSDAFSFLIQAFVNSHDFVKAEQVLEEMQGKGFEPDAHAYFTLVSAHMRENPDRSLYWVNVMITRSFVKNSEIWERILLQFVEVAKYSYANEVLDYMLKTGIRVQTASLVKLVSGFILCADMDNATRTVNKLAEYDNPLSGFHFNGVLQEFLNLGDNASVGTIVRGLQQLNFSIPNLKEQYNTKHTKIKT